MKILYILCRPKNVQIFVMNRALRRNLSETGDLARLLDIKENDRVMLTVNVGISDRLINGQIGTVKHVFTDSNCNFIRIFIVLNDPKAGVKKINSDPFAKQHLWFSIERAEANIRSRNFKNRRKNNS